MKILHVVPTYLPARRYGGTIYSVHGLCKSLVSLGYDVTVFTTNVDGHSNSDVSLMVPVNIDGVKVEYFPSKIFRRLYYSPLMKAEFKKNIKKIDVVHLHSLFLWPAWMAARIARENGVPYVVSPRGMLVKEMIRRKNSFLKLLWIALIEKKTLEQASAIHLTTAVESAEIMDFKLNLPPLYVVPNGIDISSKPDSNKSAASTIEPHLSRLLKGSPLIMFLGRISWKKGLDRLIPAMAFVPDVKLVIAGNDEENYLPVLKKMAKERGVLDRVIFIGPIYGEEKNSFLRRVSILVAPSYSENFGNVVLEAMAAGCPVIVTPEVGLSTIVKEVGAGLVVDGQPDILGRSLKSLLNDPERLKIMGQNGKNAANQFLWSAIAKQMQCMYEEMLRCKH